MAASSGLMAVLCRKFRPHASLRWLSSSSLADERFDMIIVGGGMIGLGLAAAIGHTPAMANKQVLLIDSSTVTPPTTTPTQPYSNRVCSLSLKSVNFLKSINVWDHLTRVRSYRMIYVWDSCSLANLSFDRSSEDSLGLTSQSHDNHMMSEDHMMLSEDSDASDDVMGYIVENNVILKALSDKVKECNNITIQRGVTIKSLDSNEGQQQRTVTLTDGSTLHTSLLVGADGPSSSVREMSGLGVVGWSYNQHGVVANLKVEEAGPNEVAWQRFLPDGPIALLPLTDDQCSMVWSTTPSHATHLLEMTEEQFVNSVNAALFDDYPIDPVVNASNTILKDVLSSIGTSSVRRLPPTVSGADGRGKLSLSFSHSPHYVKSRLALIGDAGHRVHPLAGLGVNLGFNDVTSLYDILLADTVAGIEWGNMTSLLSYERESQRDNVPIMAAIDGLHRLFNTSWGPVVLLRSLGLQLTDSIKPLKDLIVGRVQGKN